MENSKITPRQKAEELVKQFMLVSNKDYSLIYFPTARFHAMICCDEIIKDEPSDLDFWREVREEIKSQN